MNKKQIAIGILAATFCASTMTSCGSVYGPPERYKEYSNNNTNEKSHYEQYTDKQGEK